MHQAPGHSPTALKVIAAFKLVKGLLLLAVGLGALTLLHQDVASVIEHWLDAFRVDPGNRYLHGLIEKLELVDDRQLRAISAGTFFYAALMLTEGIGLSLAKRWAEYLTVIATSSFIPLEIYELYKRISVAKVTVLLINLAIVWYLLIRLRRSTE